MCLALFSSPNICLNFSRFHTIDPRTWEKLAKKHFFARLGNLLREKKHTHTYPMYYSLPRSPQSTNSQGLQKGDGAEVGRTNESGVNCLCVFWYERCCTTCCEHLAVIKEVRCHNVLKIANQASGFGTAINPRISMIIHLHIICCSFI